MPADDIRATGHISPFERIKHTDEAGEYWSARELAKLLGYSGWQRFSDVIERAKTACENSGHAVSDHFIGTVNMIEVGKGAHRRIDDFHLSRYACYLIVQNADPSKRIVALGQAYFAIQTRRQELAQELAGKTEDQQRVLLRDQIAEKNGHLAEAAGIAGVVTQRDFALFQDHGYRGLYTETARQIAARKGLRPSEHILDWMGPEETVDNLFRIVQAEAKIRREGIATKEGANDAHLQIGRAVREAIVGMGGTPPEQLPTPEKSLKQLRREEARRQQIEAEDRLGLFAQLNAPDGDSDSDDGD
jgi:DNA-damage-inducible protein D